MNRSAFQHLGVWSTGEIFLVLVRNNESRIGMGKIHGEMLMRFESHGAWQKPSGQPCPYIAMYR